MKHHPKVFRSSSCRNGLSGWSLRTKVRTRCCFCLLILKRIFSWEPYLKPTRSWSKRLFTWERSITEGLCTISFEAMDSHVQSTRNFQTPHRFQIDTKPVYGPALRPWVGFKLRYQDWPNSWVEVKTMQLHFGNLTNPLFYQTFQTKELWTFWHRNCLGVSWWFEKDTWLPSY